jgi:ABC-type sugar transport system ATPase subunit
MTGKKPDTSGLDHHTARKHRENETPVLEVRGLSITAKLTDINFRSYAGEIIGIGGLDGQGQQEFLRVILGDETHSQGDIVYRGQKLRLHEPADAIRRNMGFISGDRNKESIFPIRSVAGNIYAGSSARGPVFSFLSPGTVRRFAQDSVDRYGIVSGGLEKPASSLSGGNQQKLVIGRWMALAPDLLLLDDPTKGVDISTRQEIHRILKDCAAAGMCALYSSSDNEELLSISDRIYVFYEGAISAELAGGGLVEERLVAAMLGLNRQAETSGAAPPGTAKPAAVSTGAVPQGAVPQGAVPQGAGS